MKFDHFFQTIPFPFRVQMNEPYSLVYESKAPFFEASSNTSQNDSFWPELDTEGWRQCNLGYSVYSRRIPGLPKHFLVLHSLKIKGFWHSKGRTEGLSIIVNKEKIESYTDNFLTHLSVHMREFGEIIDSRVRISVTEGIHEIRSMNTCLYHVGYELQGLLRYDSRPLVLSKNIVALAELISARIALADLAASNLVDPNKEFTSPIAVFKKFDKIARCYTAYAKKREISISISGESRGMTQGIENFEMIPLIVIDNAVKYSPLKGQIDIVFTEEGDNVICEVKSLGPKIEKSERRSIFERESRGTHAISSGQGGSGIGLYFANHLMKSIKGIILVDQTENFESINGKNYFSTVFRLSFGKPFSNRI
jgi:hypothetical protein